MIITIAIATFALFMVMFMQFKIINETDVTSIEAMTEEELKTELATWKNKYQEAEEQYKEKETKLNEYKDKEESTAETTELVTNELEQVNTYLGKNDVQGEGITITLKDSTDSEIGAITAEDLLVITDYLKSAGAEAISINEERIINMSDIVFVNNSIVYINQQRVLSPYVIKAIGNQTYLESVLLGNGGYVDELRKIGFEVTIEKSDKVAIPKYNKEINYKYIEN